MEKEIKKKPKLKSGKKKHSERFHEFYWKFISEYNV